MPTQHILVVNGGSSSLKYAYFDSADAAHTTRGQIECIGGDDTRLTHHGPRGSAERFLPRGDYRDAFAAMVSLFTDPQVGPLRSMQQIECVGHRIVHGGEKFAAAAVVDDAVLAEIERLGAFAPLHNPVNGLGIREAMQALPNVPQVAVFDTAFHQTLAPEAYLYGLPYAMYAEHGIRRFGFHGASHQYVSQQAALFLGRTIESLAIISCHLGNGASVCAIEGGRSIDTSMGFTPGEGLIMGTRCGDIDAAVITHWMRTQGVDADRMESLLTKESGFLGMSGLSRDMREIEKAAAAGHERAKLALDAFCWRLRRYIGAFMAQLGRVDAIVFTGGIGQGSATVRRQSVDRLQAFGIKVDEERNRSVRGFEAIGRISPDDAPVAVLVVPTDEERMIADEVAKTLSEG
ncbi:MAG: acetate kinase [Gemmataceae bacterium]|nr:acetate kinase [Gemmataceae bacterium]